VHTSEIRSWSLEAAAAGFVTGAVTAVGVVAQFAEGDARFLVAIVFDSIHPQCFTSLAHVIE
jgi:hypothetical protein